MGAIHVRECALEEAALRGVAYAGVVVATRPGQHALDLRIEATFSRQLPQRRGLLRRLWERMMPPVARTVDVRTFAVSPPPVATDAHRHDMFERLVEGMNVADFEPGERVFVVEATFVGVLRDEPETRTRVVAAWDRTADVAWAADATVDGLQSALLNRRRADVALMELRQRRALDAGQLAARLPADRLSAVQGVFGRFDPDERAAFLDGAARQIDDPEVLGGLARTLCDFAPVHELEPLLLRLDGRTEPGAAALEFARIRVQMVLRDEPHRSEQLSRLTAHLRNIG